MPATQVVPLPDAISFETAAAAMLQGMTVNYLFHRTTPIKAGDTVLFHAAAGGVGLIACQWAKSEGITADRHRRDRTRSATRRSPTGRPIASTTGPRISSRRVRELTDGKGVDVVMDGVGKDTFVGSLDCLKPLGMMISFGSASGPVSRLSACRNWPSAAASR